MNQNNPWLNDTNCSLLTDLYELTMLQGYYYNQMHQEAIFSLFVRKLPSNRNYLLACGLEDVLRYLENLKFSEEAIDYLYSLKIFSTAFLDWLCDFKFTGDVYALPEGTPFFANEPILEIVAPIDQAQLLETFIVNQIHYQTLAASKAARVVSSAQGKSVVDFGVRRMHGTDAGIKAARAFYLAGVQATSNVFAGFVYNIPVSGTMAHSYIQAFEEEIEAFRSFVKIYPNTIILIDTYDSLKAIQKVIQISKELGSDFKIQGIRIDSSNLAELSFLIREELDQAGLKDVKIFASGGLDEYKISKIIDEKAPIDGFGVGTNMGVVEDAPYLDMVYKLTSYAGKDRIKISPGKETLPGQKQVYRIENQLGEYDHDVLTNYKAVHEQGQPLLRQVMKDGRRTFYGKKEDLKTICNRTRTELIKLPAKLHDLHSTLDAYPVHISSILKEKQKNIIEHLKREKDSPDK